MLKYTEIFMDLKYINISTLPLELRSVVDKKRKKHKIGTITEDKKEATEQYIMFVMEPLLKLSQIIQAIMRI